MRARREEGRPGLDQPDEDLVDPGLTIRAFYVKYLLPICFDVQNMERAEPAR